MKYDMQQKVNKTDLATSVNQAFQFFLKPYFDTAVKLPVSNCTLFISYECY